jgi:hypothetical protein
VREFLFVLLAALVGLKAQASVNVNVNGTTYTIPQKNEKGWGDNVTSWIQAISANTLQPSGGTFTLTADADFGANYGIKSVYFKTRSSNIAASGNFRLANTDSIAFRNSGNSSDLLLTPNATDGVLQYNGVPLVGTSLTQTLTNKSLTDANVAWVNSSDATKKTAWSLSGQTTGTTLTLATNQSTTQTLNIPNVSSGDSLATINATQTLTNKTISGSSNTLSNVGDSSLTTSYLKADGSRALTGNWGAGAFSGTFNSVVVGSAANTISALSTIVNTGTLTLPTSSDTLVGRATTDTLANKTLTSPTINTPTIDVDTFTQQSTPSNPAASKNKLYFKSDNHLYELNSSGTETQVDAAASVTSYDTASTAFNLGLSSSVGSNALTIRLKQKDGTTDPANTSSTKVSIGFRDATLTNGKYAAVDQTAALSITVNSSATLGQVSNKAAYVWIYALNDAGTMDLCVNGGDPFDDTVPTSSTQVSAGATTATTLYCASSHTGAKPIRLIGRCLETETTAGTWASNCTELDLMPIPKYNTTAWSSASLLTSAIGAVTTPPTKPTTMNTDRILWKRDGKLMRVRMEGYAASTTGSTAGSGIYLFTIPNSQSADANVVTAATTIGTSCNTASGTISALKGSGWFVSASRGALTPLLYDATRLFFCTVNATTVEAITNGGDTAYNAAATWGMSADVEIPISGWTDYGP